MADDVGQREATLIRPTSPCRIPLWHLPVPATSGAAHVRRTAALTNRSLSDQTETWLSPGSLGFGVTFWG